MNINKLMSKATIVVATIGLVAVSAHAGPPKDSGRNVIGEAQNLCKFSDDAFVPAPDLGKVKDEDIFAFACGLLWKTDGAQVEGKNCAKDASDSNGYVTYTDRNCIKNEAAQERKASSVVLSMDDVIERNKAQQVLTAADYACMYASKAIALVAVGKLDMQDADLIDDAESIADALGYPCEWNLD